MARYMLDTDTCSYIMKRSNQTVVILLLVTIAIVLMAPATLGTRWVAFVARTAANAAPVTAITISTTVSTMGSMPRRRMWPTSCASAGRPSPSSRSWFRSSS